MNTDSKSAEPYPVSQEWREVYCYNRTKNFNIWAQDLNNEQIHSRTFIIDHPPIITIHRPQGTGECLPQDSRRLHYSPTQESEIRDWWIHYSHNQSPQGSGLKGKRPNLDPIVKDKIIRQNQDHAPWLYGIKKNIDVESDLKTLGELADRDIPSGPRLPEYTRGLKSTSANVFFDLQCTNPNRHLWRNLTRMINQCPPHQRCDDHVESTHQQQCEHRYRHHHPTRCTNL